MARYGLDRLAAAGAAESESVYLEPLEEIATRGASLARQTLDELGVAPEPAALQRRYTWNP